MRILIPYENLISTLIGTRKLCTLVISMLMSILQVVGTYMCACLWESLYGVSHKHAHRHKKMMYIGHKHAHEHITGCWYIYVRACENPYMGCLISTPIGTRKWCTLVISVLMSILQDVGTYMGVLMRIPILCKHAHRYTKIISLLVSIFKQNVGTYTRCAYENSYIISTLIGTRKLCTLVIRLLMSILQNFGTWAMGIHMALIYVMSKSGILYSQKPPVRRGSILPSHCFLHWTVQF
jgi:hypothetical protein